MGGRGASSVTSHSGSQLKESQLAIITATNPAPDEYHTWIRSVDDIKTFSEALADEREEIEEYGELVYPDFTPEDAYQAIEKGSITVYSSYPIQDGTFVATSRMNASDYAGGGKVYSKTIPLEDVAWINTEEGMFAKVKK